MYLEEDKILMVPMQRLFHYFKKQLKKRISSNQWSGRLF